MGLLILHNIQVYHYPIQSTSCSLLHFVQTLWPHKHRSWSKLNAKKTDQIQKLKETTYQHNHSVENLTSTLTKKTDRNKQYNRCSCLRICGLTHVEKETEIQLQYRVIAALSTCGAANTPNSVYHLHYIFIQLGQTLSMIFNNIGLAYSHQQLGNILDTKIVENQRNRKTELQLDKPVIIIMDNINIYRGNHKHLRLNQNVDSSCSSSTLTMWNFTGSWRIF